jgi:hypothetical protein
MSRRQPDKWEAEALLRRCPFCGAGAGRWCRTGFRRAFALNLHAKRMKNE